MKRLLAIALLFGAISAADAQDPNERAYLYPLENAKRNSGNMIPKPLVKGAAAERVKENLDRGVSALRDVEGNMYVSWRLLETDPEGTGFNLYRAVDGGRFSKLNSRPVTATTDFVDKKATAGGNYTYMVRAVVKGREQGDSSVAVPIPDGQNYASIKLKGDYSFSKLAVADLNGDGAYDYVIKYPGSATDPGSWRRSGDTFKIEAYLNDGTWLWTKDLGWNIEQGVWYSPFVVYDFDGDGKAEVAVKTAPTDVDYRDSVGRVVGPVPYNNRDGKTLPASPEYCSILNGMTGEEIDRVDWPEGGRSFGDYNRNNRQMMAVAYLDGKTPALLLNRGTYRRMVVDAYLLNGKKLEKVWRWDGDEENPVVRSQNAHSITCVDIDDDGRDEVILGSVVVDDNGEALWSAGLGHPDRATVGVIDPSQPGLQILYACEVWQDSAGVSMVDAKTGKYLWTIGRKTLHVGGNMAADIDPAYPGLECFASEDGKGGSSLKYVHTAAGVEIGAPEYAPGTREWVWWDADLLRETAAPVRRDPAAAQAAQGAAPQQPVQRGPRSISVGKYRGEAVAGEPIQGSWSVIADVKGDWREEIITAVPGEIRIYSTVIPAADRRTTLMQDPLYRNGIISRAMGYDQPAMTSYYLGVPAEDAPKYTPIIPKKQ